MKIYTTVLGYKSRDNISWISNDPLSCLDSKDTYNAYVDRLMHIYVPAFPWLADPSTIERMKQRQCNSNKHSFMSLRTYVTKDPPGLHVLCTITSTSISNVQVSQDLWFSHMSKQSTPKDPILFGQYWRDITNLLGEAS